MFTSQSSKTLLRKSTKTCDKSNKPKKYCNNFDVRQRHTFTAIILSNILSLICTKMYSTEAEPRTLTCYI